ncbi:hypothetical protein EJB05_32938 [Eragrostis curvula]|uniref:DUF3615 domain-containing protein n=1 Tax=Eragrostis curvula TaxID=38414 RepID=A0A5J9TZX1_9POAL|nr:hypothetical protein EJB05_32938 [Eragrostis curvula]
MGRNSPSATSPASTAESEDYFLRNPPVDTAAKRSADLRELKEYFKEHTFDTTEDLFGFLCNSSDRAARAKDQKEQPSLDKFESEPMLEPDQALPVLAPEEARLVGAQGQLSEGSKEEIVRNGNRWMIEEVMVAFQKYREKKDDLKECDYKFDELHNQCFSVENYNHIFHHFNFTVKMKTTDSADWTSVLYFAEVKEIFGHKIYFCCPLEPEENGRCVACKNQGIDDLKHPIIGAFDRGGPDSTFPFMYDSASDDDEVEEYDESWFMRMKAAGVMIG